MMRLAPWILLVAGCAAGPPVVQTVQIGGTEVPRQSLAFTGRPYAIQHQDAHPASHGTSGGLVDDGGTISGQVCGMDLHAGVEHQGDHVQVTGLAGLAPLWLDVADRHGERRISGTLGGRAVDLRLRSGGISGRVAEMDFHLQQDGDDLVEFVEYHAVGRTAVLPMALHGRDALWQMPAADQAAVLPLLLGCLRGTLVQGDPTALRDLGFGGGPSPAPQGAVAFLHTVLPEQALVSYHASHWCNAHPFAHRRNIKP